MLVMRENRPQCIFNVKQYLPAINLKKLLIIEEYVIVQSFVATQTKNASFFLKKKP